MKKILLLAAVVVSAFSARADFADLASVTIEGTPVTEGAVMDVNFYHDNEWWEDPVTGEKEYLGDGYQYVAEIAVENLTANEYPTSIKVEYTDHPTQEMQNADKNAWGNLQICIKGEGCYFVLDVNSTLAASRTLTWQFDNNINFPDQATPNRKYKVTLTVGDESMWFYVNFQPDNTLTGVAELASNNVKAVVENNAIVVKGLVAGDAVKVFNIAGQNVADAVAAADEVRLAPGAGLYVVNVNDKAFKVVVR